MLNYRKTYTRGHEKGNRFYLINRKETINFMLMQKKPCFMKAVVIILVIALMMPVSANAAMPETVMPRASDYLACYTAYVCAMGSGRLEIWFEVAGTATQEYLGVMRIYLYESTDNVNWHWVKSFGHDEHPQMLLTNAWEVIDCVSYQGVAGRYYKAYVGIWGGPDPGGDSRYIWTSVEQAT